MESAVESGVGEDTARFVNCEELGMGVGSVGGGDLIPGFGREVIVVRSLCVGIRYLRSSVV